MSFVRIQHPEVEGSALVHERALPHLQSKGWQLADAPSDEQTAPAPEPEPAPEPHGATAVSVMPALPPLTAASDTPIADTFGADPSTSISIQES